MNIHDDSSKTALMCAAEEGQGKCAGVLITVGAGVNTKDKDGNTALLLAARNGYSNCVNTLNHAGADVNIQNKNGDTALLLASKEPHNSCCKLLIQSGTDLNVHNKNGEGALQFLLAEEYGKLLFAAGEKEAVRKYIEPKRLSHLCRASIKKHLLQMSNMNLFARVPKLGLPKPLQKYLLFSEILE